MSNYGFNDDSYVPKVVKGKFGLNHAILQEVKYLENAGKDNTPGEAIDFIFNIDGSEKAIRFYPVVKAFYKDATTGANTETEDPEHEAVIEAKNTMVGAIYHILHPFFAGHEAALKEAFGAVTDFKSVIVTFMKFCVKDYKTKKLHLFLQYSYNLRDDANRTYLQIPKNLKHGKFVCAATEGDVWERQDLPEEDSKGRKMLYTNEKGDIHPFSRNSWYMDSNFAVEQKAKEDAATVSADPNVAPVITDAATTDSSADGVNW